MSSMMLMPPTKAMRPSATAIFRCMRRSRSRRKGKRHTSGRNTSRRAPASRSSRANCAGMSLEPKPSTSKWTATARRAASHSAFVMRSPVASPA